MENKTVLDVLEKFGKDTIFAIHKSLDDKKVNASYVLRQSIDYRVELLGDEIHFKLGWTGEGNEYAAAADTGRRPGKMPPIEPIRKWIAQKGISLKEVAGPSRYGARTLKNITPRKRRSLRQQSVEQRSKSLAFMIARKIGREGTKASNFYSEVVTPQLLDKLKKDLASAYKKDILIEIKKK